MKSKVYFTKSVSPYKVTEMYDKVGRDLIGNVAIKVHSGETGNQNFLGPDFWGPVIKHVGGTVVECNTAYGGTVGSNRNTTPKHLKVLEEHGWTAYPVDLLDSEGPDMVIDLPYGKQIKQNFLGNHMSRYNALLVLSHFKGHGMAGFGGAIKNISIGIAAPQGKALIHSAGRSTSNMYCGEQLAFLESMAEAGKAVVDALDGKILYVNVMNRLSVDCDCSSNPAEPAMHDIGILASLDPVALDQACVDLVYAAPDGQALIQRMESRSGAHVLEYGEKIGLGSRKYELVKLD